VSFELVFNILFRPRFVFKLFDCHVLYTAENQLFYLFRNIYALYKLHLKYTFSIILFRVEKKDFVYCYATPL